MKYGHSGSGESGDSGRSGDSGQVCMVQNKLRLGGRGGGGVEDCEEETTGYIDRASGLCSLQAQLLKILNPVELFLEDVL